MKRVFKYPLEQMDGQKVALPVGAEILSVQVQHETIVLYALVDDLEQGFEKRAFRIAGTGHLLEGTDRMKFLGTVQLRAGNLVFHVFEVKE